LIRPESSRDGFDFAGRDALHVHFRQTRHQGLLGALIALEQFGRETPVAILRHAQLDLADASDDGARIRAGAITAPLTVALALGRANRLGHFGL